MSISIVDIANEIFLDLSQPDNTTIPEIVFYLKTHIGDLNNLILTSFYIDENQQIAPAESFGEDEKSIYKCLYYLKYYESMARQMLGAAGVYTTLEWTSDGHDIKKINRGTLAQIYGQIRKDLRTEMMDHVTYYKINRATPKSIEGQEINVLSIWPARYNSIISQRI